MAIVEIARGTSTVSSNAFVEATYDGALGTISAGHIIVCAGENDNGHATATCDDDAGVANTYSLDDANAQSVSNSALIFSAAISDAIDSGTVFTVTFEANASRKWLIVYHVDDLDDTGGRVVENGRGGATDQAPQATADAEVAVANTLTISSATVNSDGALAWTPSGTDGDVIDLSNRSGATSFRYRTATGTHVEGGTFTDSSALWSCVMVAYRQTAGGTAHALAGTVAGAGSAIGALSAGFALAGVSAGTSTATGELDLAFVLSGAAVGAASATGTLTAAWALAGVSTGTGTVTGILTVDTGEAVVTLVFNPLLVLLKAIRRREDLQLQAYCRCWELGHRTGWRPVRTLDGKREYWCERCHLYRL